MNKERFIDDILNELVKSGSIFDQGEELSFKNEMMDITNKDRSLSEVLGGIAGDIEEYTKVFLSKKNEFDMPFISGISTMVYIPDYNGLGSYKYKIIGGTKDRNKVDEIDENTLFDVASITKLFSLILIFKFEELGLLDLNTPIKDINPDIQNLEDYTINDLLRLCGELRTDGNVATASSYEEAYERLKTVYLESNDRTKGKYTDFGALVIGDTIEKVISNYLGKEMKYDEIMNEYLFKPLLINNSTFTPSIINITGNTLNDGLPHDPKSRNLLGKTAHAGLFTNSEDISKLADGLFDKGYLNQEHINRLGETTFEGFPKGNLGVFLKQKDWIGTYTPPEFSTGSFSHQGYTGGIVAFDPNNKIHNSILVNAIADAPKEELFNCKPLGFKSAFNAYQSEITKRIMLMYVAKKYYNKYCDVKEDISETKLIHTL